MTQRMDRYELSAPDQYTPDLGIFTIGSGANAIVFRREITPWDVEGSYEPISPDPVAE